MWVAKRSTSIVISVSADNDLLRSPPLLICPSLGASVRPPPRIAFRLKKDFLFLNIAKWNTIQKFVMEYKDEYIRRLNKALQFIEKNYSENILLEDIADSANFSSYHFHRIFSSMLGEDRKSVV